MGWRIRTTAQGNRLTRWDGTTLETWTYDAANQLTAILTTGTPSSYTYDGCGNLMQHLEPGQVNTYSWDGENRMVEAAFSNGVVDTFTFNGDGQRVGKTDQAGPVKYVWDRQNVLIEANASNAIQAVHTLQPAFYGNQVSQRRAGVTSYYQFNALGSTLQLTGAAGTVTDSYLYRAFGDLLTSSGTTVNPYQYGGRKGYIYDSDLYNFQVRARRYDPEMGRWWSRDPIGFAGGDANLYRYIRNRPVRGIDASGLQPPPNSPREVPANLFWEVPWWEDLEYANVYILNAPVLRPAARMFCNYTPIVSNSFPFATFLTAHGNQSYPPDLVFPSTNPFIQAILNSPEFAQWKGDIAASYSTKTGTFCSTRGIRFLSGDLGAAAGSTTINYSVKVTNGTINSLSVTFTDIFNFEWRGDLPWSLLAANTVGKLTQVFGTFNPFTWVSEPAQVIPSPTAPAAK